MSSILKPFHQAQEEFERKYLLLALTECEGKLNETARRTQIPKSTLIRMLVRYELKAKDFKPAKKSAPSERSEELPGATQKNLPE